MTFPTWPTYLAHCEFYNEEPKGYPDDVLLKGREFVYYCRIHDVGYNSVRLAERHVTGYKMRYRGRAHPTAAEMATGA